MTGFFQWNKVRGKLMNPRHKKNSKNNRHKLLVLCNVILTAAALSMPMSNANAQANANNPSNFGITPTSIRVGAVMDLVEETKTRSEAMKAGVEAAFKNEKVQGRTIEYIVLNDSFNPKVATEATQQLIKQGLFAMLGNTGGPSIKAILPILAENKIPAVGFPIGVSYLRTNTSGIVNFRASFAQEANLVIETALAAGVKPQEICAYLPNDAAGLSNLAIIKAVLAKQPGMAATISKIGQIMALTGEEPDRNNIGPVGFYPRFTQNLVHPGYNSLKNWEKSANTRCRLVMIIGGSNPPVTAFIHYSRYKGENWVVSVTSQIEAPSLVTFLADQKIADRVIMTQVVPPLDAPLPIVEEARKALAQQFNNISLEGYIVGKMFLAMLRSIKGEMTPESFLKAAQGHSFNLGGVTIDFTNDNQGSDLVHILYLDGEAFKSKTITQLQTVF